MPPGADKFIDDPKRINNKIYSVNSDNNNEFVTGWRMCIDYQKLNAATKKDHFPLLFIDEMLERLAKHSFFYFLDEYSGYHQILITPMIKAR